MPVWSSFSYIFGPLFTLMMIGVLVLILRWAFTARKTSLVAAPARPGRQDEYGMLVAVSAPDTYIQAEIERLKLVDAGIKATLADTTEGPRIMVFPKDEQRAFKVLGQGR